MDPFYNATIDTNKGTTEILENGLAAGGQDDRKYPMPPGSVTLKQKGYATIRLSVNSQEQFRYEGAIVIDAIINGNEVQYRIGDQDHPLRWITRADSEDYGQHAFYGWDSRQRAWVKNYSPPSQQ
ncbi:hypothetical protein ACQP2P_43095 [Dactylosporangium sp. CA-139114]|uniref:hypothetical protein n=1 Tax=Dactylosporangium sp. CA-139114 TaxID=3239931 RepID=UPI003D97FBB0